MSQVGHFSRLNEPPCESRLTLPLPPELIRCILFLVSEPGNYHNDLKFKFSGERKPTYQPSCDIQNARLVCKAFADLGAPFLFKELCISADHDQLAHVEHISNHARFSKAARTLIYDSDTYSDPQFLSDEEKLKYGGEYDRFFSWAESDKSVAREWSLRIRDWSHRVPEAELEGWRGAGERVRRREAKMLNFYLKQQPSPSLDVPNPAKIVSTGWLGARKRVYRQQENILRGSLDSRCLETALAALPAVTKVVCSPGHWRACHCSPVGMVGVDRCSNMPDTGRYQTDTRPLYNLFEAIRSTPNNIHAADLTFHLCLLADATKKPHRFSALCVAFTPIKDLKLAVTSEKLPYRPELCDGEELSFKLYQKLLQSGALGRLIGSAKNLHRLKLNLAKNGKRRKSESAPLYGVPLSAYVGAGANDTWPDLRYLYVGSIDVRGNELIEFLMAHRKIEYLDFDCVTLTEGQWSAVSAVAWYSLAWKLKQKQNRLRQVDPEAKCPLLPPEVEKVAELSADGSLRHVYFRAGDGCGTFDRVGRMFWNGGSEFPNREEHYNSWPLF
ncbi:hypothetical protein SLS57_007378 [Botryosphaeria dothidea]